MSQKEIRFIQELALDMSKRYKGEGYYLNPSDYFVMAKEAFEEMQDDFE